LRHFLSTPARNRKRKLDTSARPFRRCLPFRDAPACNPEASFASVPRPDFLSGGARYMLGTLSSVLEEVESAFDGYQFYKASQVSERERLCPPASTRGLSTRLCVCRHSSELIESLSSRELFSLSRASIFNFLDCAPWLPAIPAPLRAICRSSDSGGSLLFAN